MDDSNCNTNSLGFSLSPQMNMEVAASADPLHHHHHDHYTERCGQAVTGSLPTSFCLSSSSELNGQGFCYGVFAEDGGFHSLLTAMPLRSDGSLCFMEALNRSPTVCEGLVPNSSPKLEDFLGGATRERMAQSLDSIYYQNPPEPQNNNRQRQHDKSDQGHCCSEILSCHGMYQPSEEGDARVTQLANYYDPQIPQMGHHHNHDHDSMFNLKDQMLVAIADGGGVDDGSGASVGCGGDLRSLSLSMSPGSQSSCVTAQRQISPGAGSEGFEGLAIEESKKKVAAKSGQKQIILRKSIETFGQRTSQYRGVTRHRWTGRYEAHLWDNSWKKEGQTRKGRQVYLGGYDMEERAARAYDLAALKYWGPSTHINFSLENYREELEEMKNKSRQEYVAHLRRKSSGFSRGASMYRGVTRHHQHGRWQARIGRVAGNKDLYLGTFSTQEEAAEAYDIAAIRFRGGSAVTNFDINKYDVERIMASDTLLAGELARRSKAAIGYNKNCSMQNSFENAGEAYRDNRESDSALARIGNCQDASVFSMALHNIAGIDSLGCDHLQQVMDESGKAGAHLSNPSSLVTSLSSLGEGSLDKHGSRYINPAASLESRFSSAHVEPSTARCVARFPVFAGWNDT